MKKSFANSGRSKWNPDGQRCILEFYIKESQKNNNVTVKMRFFPRFHKCDHTAQSE